MDRAGCWILRLVTVPTLLLLAGALLLFPAPALAFSDTAGHPYADAISDLSGRGIINGFEDGTFGPNKLVMRQQFAKMIVGTMGLTPTEQDVCPFPDVAVSGPGNLYPDNFVAVAAAKGITTGYKDGKFKPGDNISRAQVVTMVVRAADNLAPGLLDPTPGGFASTWGSFDSTHGPNAAKAEANALLAGFPLGSLDPWGKMPRGEVAQVLHNLLALMGGSDANPLLVRARVAAAGRVEQEVPAKTGGVVTSTGADGSRYTLTLPPGALLSDVTVTMTPLAGVDDLPLDPGLLAGVQLGPDGLMLVKPATLTISPGAPVPLGSGEVVTGFGYQAAGAEFFLNPAAGAHASYTLELSHFSGAGVAQGTRQQVQFLRSKHPPSSRADRMKHDDDRSLTPAERKAWLAEAWVSGKQVLKEAVNDPDLVVWAHGWFMQWWSSVTAEGMTAEFRNQHGEAWDLLSVAVDNAAVKGQRRALGKDFLGVVALLQWAQFAEANSAELARRGVTAAEYRTMARALLRFQLSFRSLIKDEAGLGGLALFDATLTHYGDWAVRPNAAVMLDETVIFPTVPGQTLDATFLGGRAVTISGLNLNLDLNPYTGPPQLAPLVPPYNLVLDITFPITGVSYRLQGPGNIKADPFELPVSSWMAYFSEAHRADAYGPGAFTVGGWVSPWSGKFAHKQYDARAGESTEFTLEFDPPGQ